MLSFYSASNRIVNTKRGVIECMEVALGEASTDCDLVILHASIGHNFNELIEQTKLMAPNARILAASCCGIVGREGVSESMKDIALMAIKGKEFTVGHIDNIYGHNSYEKCLEMIRPYNLEKKRLITNVNNCLTKYRLFFS